MDKPVDLNKYRVVPGGKLTPLEHLQKLNAISWIGGGCNVLNLQEVQAVLDGDPKADVHFMKRTDANVRMQRQLENCDVPCSNTRAVVNEWWVSPKTTEYNSQAFTPLPQPPDVLNLYSGITVKPIEGEKEDYKILKDFIYEVICDDNEELGFYLGMYLAHAVQRPEEKTGICIVLIGDEGVGKGFFFQLLKRIWGKTTLLVQDLKTITGQFNKILERNYIICMDEALYKGERAATDKLKSFITEPTVQIEGKHEPSREIASIHRFFAATNRDHFAHILPNDRRFLFIRVSNRQRQNTEYFAELSAALNDGKTVEAFVHHLMDIHLDDFDFRRKPHTPETYEQKKQSLQGVQRYWLEVLTLGDFNARESMHTISRPWYEPDWISSADLLDEYRNYNRSAEKYEPIQISHLYKAIQTMCPSVKTGARKKGNARGLGYPHIDAARQEFETWFQDKVPEWDMDT
jgi:hypothetical protein